MDRSDIEAKLYKEAAFARNPDQRLAQIPSIMANLWGTRQKVG
jgi:hypothetical protein